MRTVNLLPAWYLQQHRQRRQFRAHLAVMLALAGLMTGAWYAGQDRLAALQARRTALAGHPVLQENPSARLTTEQAELRRLEDLQLAYRELGKTVPMSAVIQQVRNDMTPGMALGNILIEVRPDPVKGSGAVGDVRNPPRYHDVAYLDLEGIAPNDVQIAQLIEKLSLNPLFSEVALAYTRTGTLQNYLVRRFQIKMKMDLERLSVEDTVQSKVASTGGTHGQ